MASIYRATDLRDERVVALKIPHPDLEADPILFDRFSRESAIGEKLDHPKVMRVFGAEKRSRVYMVMEWCDGHLLRHILAEGKMSHDRAIRLTIAILDALQYIHANGVVHRDLKPENIMVDANDDIKLIDFGIAGDAAARRLTYANLTAALTVLFSDLEGRLHLLDYDKKFLLASYDNLTFDGSSIRGFTAQKESDLRLGIDWSAFYWVPADVFGTGKVLVFGTVIDKSGAPYAGDLRGVLKNYSDNLYAEKGYTLNAANEIEGFLFAGADAEKKFHQTGAFEFVSTGGYYHSLPLDPLRAFIDTAAEVQRAMGFQNEKDHPEVAPSQFEINYGYSEVVAAADQIQLYKLLSRQIASSMGCTASFLPKPVVGVNGSGMHTNMSITKDKTNLFWDANGQEQLSACGWQYIDHILSHALDICLIMNPSVNSYRRLDPHFEAPNQIKASATDRGSMVRVPIGNSRSMRVEVRSVAPDANPYLVLYALFKTGLDGTVAKIDNLRQAQRYLPDNIYTAIEDFRESEWIAEILGADVQGRFADLKLAAADRSPRQLGTFVKPSEVQYHHEIYNQALWNHF